MLCYINHDILVTMVTKRTRWPPLLFAKIHVWYSKGVFVPNLSKIHGVEIARSHYLKLEPTSVHYASSDDVLQTSRRHCLHWSSISVDFWLKILTKTAPKRKGRLSAAVATQSVRSNSAWERAPKECDTRSRPKCQHAWFIDKTKLQLRKTFVNSSEPKGPFTLAIFAAISSVILRRVNYWRFKSPQNRL